MNSRHTNFNLSKEFLKLKKSNIKSNNKLNVVQKELQNQRSIADFLTKSMQKTRNQVLSLIMEEEEEFIGSYLYYFILISYVFYLSY